MSFIDNIKSEIDEASARYDLMNDKIMLFESVAYNNAIIKQKEAYLDAYKYGGDINDYFTESNDEKFSTKIKRAIDKIIQNLRDFLKKCKEKIIDIFEKIRESSLVKKVENLFKANPKAANIKVEMEDNSRKINLLEKELESNNKQKAKIKSGKISEKDIEEIEERNNKVAVIVAASAALIAVSLGVAFNKMKNDSRNFNKKLEECNMLEKDWIAFGNEIDKLNEDVRKFNEKEEERIKKLNGEDIDVGHVATRLASTESKIKSAKARLVVNSVSEFIEAIKRGLSSIGGNIPSPIEYEPTASEKFHRVERQVAARKAGLQLDYSSAHEDLFNSDEYFSELCNDIFGKDDSSDDFDKMYSELCNNIFF